MHRDECESTIRGLAHDWASETGAAYKPPVYPSVTGFMAWAESKGYGQFLTFRSKTSTRDDIERWLIDELKHAQR